MSTKKESPVVRDLLEEAFRILQHDTGEHNEEYVYLRGQLAKSFEQILNRHRTNGRQK
ncbi:hypothetical protein [Paraburkholderia sp. C35]|uniref:hypothetical protein n=1 Tax=Paraburkholderia sp. C35 TaxID=2126993 RepID=UPI0013A58580|nr:hypothetical protein [Paraburkholderia sp. C35]